MQLEIRSALSAAMDAACREEEEARERWAVLARAADKEMIKDMLEEMVYDKRKALHEAEAALKSFEENRV